MGQASIELRGKLGDCLAIMVSIGGAIKFGLRSREEINGKKLTSYNQSFYLCHFPSFHLDFNVGNSPANMPVEKRKEQGKNSVSVLCSIIQP